MPALELFISRDRHSSPVTEASVSVTDGLPMLMTEDGRRKQ